MGQGRDEDIRGYECTEEEGGNELWRSKAVTVDRCTVYLRRVSRQNGTWHGTQWVVVSLPDVRGGGDAIEVR